MKIKKILAAVPAACLLLTVAGAMQAGAVELSTVTSGAVVEVFNRGENDPSVTVCGSPAEAWAKANASASIEYETVITLGTDWVEDEQLVTAPGKRITLDLNGHYIKRDRKHEMKRNGSVFLVSKGSIFTLRDSDPRVKGYDGVRGGVITGGASSNTGGGVHIEEDGQFHMQGGTIYDCITDEDGGGVYLDGGSDTTRFEMTGGRIYACKTIDSADECNGGGVYLNRGTVDISNAKIDDCYSEDDGGAIFSERGIIKLNNVILSGNKAREKGGAIYTAHDIAKYIATEVHAYNCIFAGNQAQEDGGAVFINDNPDKNRAVLFHNCAFRSNSAKGNGGALHITDDNIALSSCEIIGNTAGKYGGGVFVDGRYDITLKGLMTVKDNTSEKDGAYANLTLEKGTLGTARIINGGLYRNSCVYLGSTSDSSVLVSEFMSHYQMRYFKADVGSLSQTEFRQVNAQVVLTSSIFSDGGFLAVAILGGAGIIGTAALIVYQKKKKKAPEGGEEND